MNSYTVKNWMWLIIILMFIAIACLSGCSTVAGVGKDIQDSATWTKEKIGGSK
jgi:predicted small secreted protein